MLQLLQSLLNRKPSSNSIPQGMQRMPNQQPFGPRNQFGMQPPMRGGGYRQMGNARNMMNQRMMMGPGPQNMMNGSNLAQTGASKGGMLSSFLNGGAQGASTADIPGMLTNVQNALGMAQKAIPMIQQYGPMVKNAPALLSMMKEFKNLEDDDGSSSEDIEEADTTELNEEEVESFEEETIKEENALDSELELEDEGSEKEVKKTGYEEKKSTAKLYI